MVIISGLRACTDCTDLYCQYIQNVLIKKSVLICTASIFNVYWFLIVYWFFFMHSVVFGIFSRSFLYVIENFFRATRNIYFLLIIKRNLISFDYVPITKDLLNCVQGAHKSFNEAKQKRNQEILDAEKNVLMILRRPKLMSLIIS